MVDSLALEDLKNQTVRKSVEGRKIVKARQEKGILALHLDNETVLIISTEFYALGITEGAKT